MSYPTNFYVEEQVLAPMLRKEPTGNPKRIYALAFLLPKKSALKLSIGLNFFMKAITSTKMSLIAYTKTAKN